MQTLLCGEESSVGNNPISPWKHRVPQKNCNFLFLQCKKGWRWRLRKVFCLGKCRGRLLQWWSTPLSFPSLPWQHNTAVAPAYGPNVSSLPIGQAQDEARGIGSPDHLVLCFPPRKSDMSFTHRAEHRAAAVPKEWKTEPASQTQICISEWQAVCG